jgi:hypothetical protein
MFLTEKLKINMVQNIPVVVYLLVGNSCSSMTMILHTQQILLSLYFRNTLNAYEQKKLQEYHKIKSSAVGYDIV